MTGRPRLTLVRGDITRIEVDAVVNAANQHLAPGGGVSGAIHRAGGPSIAAEARVLVHQRGPLRPGEAVITGAGWLPARHVIHAVGPVWHGGTAGEGETLRRAYQASIEVADSSGLVSIAFPSLSTGIYGYPVEVAAPVAVRAVRDALGAAQTTCQATFVLFDDATYRAYDRALSALAAESAPGAPEAEDAG